MELFSIASNILRDSKPSSAVTRGSSFFLITLQKSPPKFNHLNSLADSSHVPVSSTARIIRKLVKNNFVEELKIGKWSVYRLAENKQTEVLKEL